MKERALRLRGHLKASVMDMNCHPTTSASSHLLEGVFLGVSIRSRNQKSLKFPALFCMISVPSRGANFKKCIPPVHHAESQSTDRSRHALR